MTTRLRDDCRQAHRPVAVMSRGILAVDRLLLAFCHPLPIKLVSERVVGA